MGDRIMKMLSAVPALMIDGILAIGDVHIGYEQKLALEGMHFPNAGKRIAEKVMRAYSTQKAKGLVLLGDVKESIGYPAKEEYRELQLFFYETRKANTRIAKGNHDGHLQELISRMRYPIDVEKEIRVKKTTFMHGNSFPSDEAMACNYIIAAHSHVAVESNGKREKAFLIAGIGKGARKRYKAFNRAIKLVVVPPINDLVVGHNLKAETKSYMPVLRQEVFDFENAEIYTDRQLGKVNEVIEL